MRRSIPIFLLAAACSASPAADTARESAPPNERDNSSDATPGFDWNATIRAALTAAQRPGAVVVLDAKDGSLVASYEIGDESMAHPLRQAHHPASSLKPLLYLGALEAEILEPDETISCSGSLDVQGQRLTCFAEHGELDSKRAIATSCNVFAFEVANRMGLDSVVALYRSYGFGEATGLLEGEEPGTVPDRAFYEAHGGFEPAHTAATATGHAQMRATPLQLAHAYATHLSAGSSPYRGHVIAGMRAAVDDEIGTARAARVDGLAVAGKTGTAEVEGGEGFDAWFTALAPADDPEVVVTVFVHGGGMAPESAVPVAGEILRPWQASRR